jgi:hypothetical protein
MADTVTPYIERHPRDLITAEDWNHVQKLIKKDIEERLEAAIKAISSVPKADDAGKLAGKTPEELARQLVDSALQEVNKRTGYMRIFRKLPVTDGDEVKVSLVEHGLKDFPVTDVYQLETFDVICSEDDVKEKEQVLFYLYHSSEKKIRTKDAKGDIVDAEIERSGDAVFKIPFAKMLELYKVEYDDDTSLGDLETEFWEAFFSKPNDEFEDDEQCHSPWFDRCCGEKRSVAELKRRGDWDELWLKTQPVKTVNADAGGATEARRPPHVRVEQYDFDQLGLIYRPPAGSKEPLPVMVLLKV